MARLADQEGVAVVLVTHDPLEAVMLCDLCLVLEHGRLVERGALQALLAPQQPRSETLRAFRTQLGAVKRLE
jgi:ABC-type glutathione transport system ATPase component